MLHGTCTVRLSVAERELIREAAARASEVERKRVTASSLIRRIVLVELADELKGTVSTAAAGE